MFEVCRGGPRISHFLFADDLFIFTKASTSQSRVVMKVISEFCAASG